MVPQFVYLGDHAETEVFGFRFRAGEATDVGDERAVFKLRNNPHFSEVFDGVEVMPSEPKKRKYTRRAES